MVYNYILHLQKQQQQQQQQQQQEYCGLANNNMLKTVNS